MWENIAYFAQRTLRSVKCAIMMIKFCYYGNVKSFYFIRILFS